MSKKLLTEKLLKICQIHSQVHKQLIGSCSKFQSLGHEVMIIILTKTKPRVKGMMHSSCRQIKKTWKTKTHFWPKKCKICKFQTKQYIWKVFEELAWSLCLPMCTKIIESKFAFQVFLATPQRPRISPQSWGHLSQVHATSSQMTVNKFGKLWSNVFCQKLLQIIIWAGILLTTARIFNH